MAPDRVADHLLSECAKWSGHTSLMIATTEGFEPEAHFEAQLDGFAAVGVLSADEVSVWRQRFREATGPVEPVTVDDELRARVERYLESLVPAAALADEDPDPLSTAVQVLEEIGVLSEEEGMRWFNRALEADPDFDPDEEDDDFPEYEARELRQVLLGPDEETGGVRVVSVEVYDDTVAVRWTMSADAPVADDFGEPEFRLSDDAGTEYGDVGGSFGSGGSERTRGVSGFVPGAPAGASRLVLAWAGVSHAFELRP